MSKDFEDQLRAALRPVDPGEEFTQRVASRVVRPERIPHAMPMRFRWVATALAASVVIAALIGYQWQAQREQRGLEARRQLIEALRVTGEKLEVAYQAVNAEPSPVAGENPGV